MERFAEQNKRLSFEGFNLVE